MGLIYVFLSSLLLLSISAFALSDPNQILERSDQFLGKPTFAESFRENDRFFLSIEDCTFFAGTHCSTTNLSARVSVQTDPATHRLTAQLHYASGEVGTISQEKWDSNLGNSLRIFIDTISSYGVQVELLSFAELDTTVLVNNELRTLRVLRVVLKAISGVTNAEHTIDLSKDLRGPGQIIQRVELSEAPIKSKKTLRLSSAELAN